MRLYTKNTAGAVLRGSVSVFAVLMLIALIVGIADWLRHFEDSIALGLIFAVTLLTVPQLVAYILPLCLLIGVCSHLYGVIRNGELTALETAGLSPWQHAKPYVIVALLVSVVLFLVSEFVFAPSYRLKQQLSERAKSLTQAENILKSGMFISLGEGLTVFVKSVGSDGLVEGLTIARLPQGDRFADGELFFHVKQGLISQKEEGLSISGEGFAIAYASGQGQGRVKLGRGRVDMPVQLGLPAPVVIPVAFLPIRELFRILSEEDFSRGPEGWRDTFFFPSEREDKADGITDAKLVTMFIYERIGLWLTPYLIIATILFVIRLYPWSRNYAKSVIVAAVSGSFATYFGSLFFVRYAGEHDFPWFVPLGVFLSVIMILSLPWLPHREKTRLLE